jgi:hypothetical protein
MRQNSLAGALAALAVCSAPLAAQQLPSPRDFFGHDIGADYVLPDYAQLTEYWRRLDAASDRVSVIEIGRTAEGRPQLAAIVTSPANQARLEQFRSVSERLARARNLDSVQARALAATGRAVVWIDGGLHANEVLGAQQLIETVWQLASRQDAETRRILDDVIVLAVHANPDGMDLVSRWYMRESVPERRSTGDLPRLYQKYIGHDDNRDFFASTQPETENMNRLMYHRWYPQIVYNHHQTGPTGTVMFAPPFRDPFNYVYDPLVVTELDLVGAAMHSRFLAEGKSGVTLRGGSNYSTWWNGGLRTTAYFHNMVGLLTETIGNPTPFDIPFVASRQLASGDLPAPVAPQRWHFRRSIDYSVTANYAVLDLASRYRETLLFNIWRMGSNSIARGSRDSWTVYPRRVDEVRDSMRAAGNARTDADGVMSAGGLVQGTAGPAESARFDALLHQPEWRDPRAYVIPADQEDFATAVKFVNALRENGVEVHRARARFSVGRRSYPAGSFIIWTAQAFRPHVLDMFEPQDHPHDFRYEGGPPIPPYDNAGWTLAYQMGVRFDRILEPLEVPADPVTEWNLPVPPGQVSAPRWAPEGYLLSPRQNDAFAAVNRLLQLGATVGRVTRGDEDAEAGAFYVTGPGLDSISAIAERLGVDFRAIHDKPTSLRPVRPLRIALWDRYGGSMPSGWVRYLLDQWGYRYEVVYPQQLDAGNLNAKYDVIVFVGGAIPQRDSGMARGPEPARIPAEFRSRLGNVTVGTTVPRIREFLEQGGTVVAIGSSTVLARHLGLPIEDHLATRDSTGRLRHLPRERFYIPGSVLSVAVDSTQPAAWGMGGHADVMFDDSPVMRLGAGAEAAGIRPIMWFDTDRPLRSGWAWGQEYLKDGVAAAEAPVGRGRLLLFGPEITFRAQPHGTFRLLFNALQ